MKSGESSTLARVPWIASQAALELGMMQSWRRELWGSVDL